MTTLPLQFASWVHRLTGSAGGWTVLCTSYHAASGEVTWRVVHAGGCSAGVMLLAIAVPSQWMTLDAIPSIIMSVGFIVGTYLLCLGMYIAAIWDTRGIPGGGTPLNRLISGLYGTGTVMTLIGGVHLVYGLLRSV